MDLNQPTAVPPATSLPQETSRPRVWPAIVIVASMWLIRWWGTTGDGSPQKFMIAYLFGPLLAVLGLLIWWLVVPRIRGWDRLLIVGSLIGLFTATVFIGGQDFPLMALILFAVPALCTVWAGWMLVSIPLAWPVRRAGLLTAFALTLGICTLLRVDGMDGAFAATFNWRWTPTAEQQLLSELHDTAPSQATSTETPAAEPLVLQPGDWPGFRGAERDGRLHGVQIATNWDQSPPKKLWSRRIGPGWSSFTVIGNRLFTQEQRGEDELVTCYDADTGNEVWTHADATRFSEVVAGPGPRATPTFHEGRLYAAGANGSVTCLDAATGKAIWTKNVIEDSQATVPQWGYSGSPLIAHGLVSVFAGGPEGKSVLAYRADDGQLAWSAGEGKLSYCSTQISKLDGVEQMLLTTDQGLLALEPESGKLLWQHLWPTEGVVRIVQPAVLNNSDVLIGTGMGVGTRRIRVTHTEDNWPVEEQWTSKQFKPYFNDFVIHEDKLYGFDGPILMCVDLANGKPSWRARGYGNGQVLLLTDQNLLLVLTETGEVALVEAQPKKHVEICRIPAITGKTWNHPVIAHGRLFVRNAEEMACFELTPAEVSAVTTQN